jgi:hypothetical protein
LLNITRNDLKKEISFYILSKIEQKSVCGDSSITKL